MHAPVLTNEDDAGRELSSFLEQLSHFGLGLA
jgi:hypothetical protein